MTRFLILVLILFTTILVNGQDVVLVKDLKSKDKKKFKKALQWQSSSEYGKALKSLDDLVQKYPGFIEAIARKGAIYYTLEDYDHSIESFTSAITLSSEKPSKKLYLSLATSCRLAKRYEEAVDAYDEYLALTSPESKSYRIAKRHRQNALFAAKAIKNPISFDPERLSSAVNSEHLEYLPAYVADGTRMIFTRRLYGQEDFYEAIIKNDTILDARPIDALNTSNNEGAHTISADGNHLIFTVCDHRRTIGSCDLYQSRRDESRGAWTTPASMGAFINSISWDAQPCLADNGQTLIFSSKRPGGSGGADLWITTKDGMGRWKAPKNMGQAINNKGNQESPYLHPDGRTLYFRSDGHPGMGQFDLFVSRMSSDGSWSTPQNLGYPLNTVGDEGGLYVSLDGESAYFSTDLGAQRDDQDYNLDIFRFTLPDSLRPYPSSYIKLRALDAADDAPLAGTITIYDDTQKLWNYGDVRPGSAMVTTLAVGQTYQIIAESEGYQSREMEITLDSTRIAAKAYEVDVPLSITQDTVNLATSEPVVQALPAKGKKITLEQIRFEKDSAVLKPSSMPQIDMLHTILTDNPDIRVQIIGHTSSEGDDGYNMRLSNDRAKAVREALIAKGIAPSRLSSEGRGSTEPIAPNVSAYGRQKNRRVEFVVL